MKITKEHYRDFIVSLNTERIKLNARIEEMTRLFKKGELDYCDIYEYDDANKSLDHFTFIQEFFMESDRWAEFETLDLLKTFVYIIEQHFNALDEYSKAVLPIDGKNTIGITSEEWEEIEDARFKVRKKFYAWLSFVDFCEDGRII